MFWNSEQMQYNKHRPYINRDPDRVSWETGIYASLLATLRE